VKLVKTYRDAERTAQEENRDAQVLAIRVADPLFLPASDEEEDRGGDDEEEPEDPEPAIRVKRAPKTPTVAQTEAGRETRSSRRSPQEDDAPTTEQTPAGSKSKGKGKRGHTTDEYLAFDPKKNTIWASPVSDTLLLSPHEAS
jgi:hypothetical protein